MSETCFRSSTRSGATRRHMVPPEVPPAVDGLGEIFRSSGGAARSVGTARPGGAARTGGAYRTGGAAGRTLGPHV